LFEDNAEYGYGIGIGVNQMRNRIEDRMKKAMDASISSEVKEIFGEWLENKNNADKTMEIAEQLIPLLKKEKDPLAQEILSLEHYLVKKSIWIIGGDGWAYDIGYGGLDHVIASGDDVNILVLDTEVYSNTGGQASKSTPVGAVAKFAASGMKTRKKDLGAMAMTYGYVFIAQVAMGASQSQFFKAIKEAEAYPGPSIIIAYAPCIAHGLKAGMGSTQMEEKRAVQAGYWQNYRYNPLLEAEGKNPFTLDSKEPDWNLFQEFLNSEVRYTSLKKSFPEEARKLFKLAESDAKWRYQNYKRLAEQEY
jgi:pyruvate-ferredoxin/flavodoxin oxidoreductase